MSSRCLGLALPLHPGLVMRRCVGRILLAVPLVALAAACGGDPAQPVNPVSIASIVINGGNRELERGTSVTLTATARNAAGAVVSIPFAWRSSVDSVASFGLNGKLTAGDTGVAAVTASALGITSAAIGVHVVWRGAAKIAALQFNPPNAITPATDLTDSLRVVVTNLDGGPAIGAKVAFAVTAGGGTVAPATVTIGQSGVGSTKWSLGPATGLNSVTATVVDDAGTPVTYVQPGSITFSLKTYAALAVVRGDGQTGGVLSPLPVAPSVRLVDSLGRPRAGIPVNFSTTGNGRVANAVASTSADGIVSPGVWTLGDVPGDQQLIVTTENARLVLHATATGTTVRLSAKQIATVQMATCAQSLDQLVSCFGQPPQIGTGDTTRTRSVPTPTKGGVHLASLVGGSAHFCGLASDLSIYCWGINSYADTTGKAISSYEPTRLQSNVGWLQVSPGGEHNCALANDRTAYCWGVNAAGQLGDNGSTQRFVPQAVAGGFKFNAISAGGSHTCGITLDATAFCWGLNSSGQLGDGTATNRATPTAVLGGIKWKAIGAGGAWTCGLNETGAAYCWGAGVNRVVPGPYPSAPVFTSLSVGAAHVCAVTGDGKVYCWGDNSSGQLGDGTTTSRDVPTEVPTGLRFASVSAGFQHSCGITTEGFVACWGRNTVGELGVSTPLVQLTPRYIVLEVRP